MARRYVAPRRAVNVGEPACANEGPASPAHCLDAQNSYVAFIPRRRTCRRVAAAPRAQNLPVKTYLATTGVLFAVLAMLHVWRVVVEWPGIRVEFWIVAGGSPQSAVLALWALKLLWP